MPIYEYQCSACGEAHDALQKISDDPLTTCPKCGKEGLERLVSASSFALKGGGWYADGYGGGGKPSAATSEKASSTTSVASKPTESKSTEKKSTSTDTKSGD